MRDPYVYPGTNILVNKFGLHDSVSLGNVESLVYNNAIIRGISNGTFDLNHLKNIHKELFSEVYSWAGQLRTVDISKGDSTFCRSCFIEKEATKLLADLAMKDQCLTIHKEKTAFVERFAHYYCEANVIHPFREGNGRATRVFFEQLAAHNNYSLDMSAVTKAQWINASIAGLNCDNSKLEYIFSKALHSTKLNEFISTNVGVDTSTHHSKNDNLIISQTAKNILLDYVQKEIKLGAELSNQMKNILANPENKTELAKQVNESTLELKEHCAKSLPKIKAELGTQNIPAKPNFAKQIDYKDIQQRLISNQINQGDINYLLRGIEKRAATPIQQLSLSQNKGIKT